MRNPPWTEDEVVLALDLYFRLEWKDMEPENEYVVEVSKWLNALPGQGRSTVGDAKYRNPNGVSMKLQNFKAFDPRYDGKGLERGSKMDRKVFERFAEDREGLIMVSSQLKSIIENAESLPDLSAIPDDDIPFEVSEGNVVYRLHRSRERSSKVSKRKKQAVLSATGKLECEACGFDFKATYGDLGNDFCEVHHRVPLSELDAGTKTRLSDLAVVCANCHRMLHRMKEMSVAGLKRLIKPPYKNDTQNDTSYSVTAQTTSKD